MYHIFFIHFSVDGHLVCGWSDHFRPSQGKPVLFSKPSNDLCPIQGEIKSSEGLQELSPPLSSLLPMSCQPYFLGSPHILMCFAVAHRTSLSNANLRNFVFDVSVPFPFHKHDLLPHFLCNVTFSETPSLTTLHQRLPSVTLSCQYFFFFWLHHVACGILVPQPGIQPLPPAVEARSLNPWTAREVPPLPVFLCY